ncbi:MAG: hypothetical protein AB1505_15705 [Candidatus Latescibacterota bacterium]
MNTRERILAVLDYREYDRLPVLHFGFLGDTLAKWQREGHIDLEELGPIGDASPGEEELSRRLGFDGNYHRVFGPNTGLDPGFESRVLEVTPEGFRKVLTGSGAIVLESDDNQSISPHVDHILKGRGEWEAEYLPRLRFSAERVRGVSVNCGGVVQQFDGGGREYLLAPGRQTHILMHCGSLYGSLRNWLGMENLCYLQADDEALFVDMIDANAELCFRCTEAALASGVPFDIGHFWEDIAFKNGPLVNPQVLRQRVGPHYRRITDLLHRHGIHLVSLDCDGSIDSLVGVWLDNGVNVMFPIEVGTWGASIEPWRRQYGRELRGVGGMDKRVLARDYAAVDAEVERLRRLVDLGGYLPCMDHRIAGDAKWENVQYYCGRMRQVFG